MGVKSPIKIASNGELQQMQVGDSINNNFLSFVYLFQNLQTNVKIWTGEATTIGGVATFFPTSDNTSEGTAIFTTIFSIHATSINNTNTIISIGSCEVKEVSVGNQTITVNCINGAGFVPDGRTIYLTIMGI